MPLIDVRDAEIAVEQVGAGDQHLVLIHGFQNSRSAWMPFVDRLDTNTYRVTLYDLVGAGDSSRPPAPGRCSIAEYASDLIALCSDLGLDSPVVVGHSLGGAVALQAVLDGPDRFRALVLVAPASTSGLDFVSDDIFETLIHPKPEDRRALAEAAFKRPPSPEGFEELMAIISRASPEHIEGSMQSMRVFDPSARLAELRVPVLLVCGDRDRHVPLRNHLATQQKIPRCRLQVYFDVGHVPFIEVADRFADDVTRFLDSL